jgi:superfamily II DNA or RNA helicase/HKD family nuclease/SOS-response transcriptional repressor LexA
MTQTSLILQHDLLTVGGNDPLLTQLIHAINHACEIEIAVSFIRQSGLNLLMPALSEAIERKAKTRQRLKLRILTSDYLGITEPTALRSLLALEGDEIECRIFEAEKQSFHMKSYIFVRLNDEGVFDQGSAYIGSNNISQPALTNAHEWCLRYDYSHQDDEKTKYEFDVIRDQFNVIFHNPVSRPLTDNWINHYIQRRQAPEVKAIVNIVAEEETPEYLPNIMQELALLALKKTRQDSFRRGLVVMGTGMGKTFLSAFDTVQLNAKRVLFIAHREEILSQALNTFAKIYPEKSSGYYHGKTKQYDSDLLFASVQTIGQHNHLRQFKPDHFDYVIIDEFHHASANTYQNVLNYFEPLFLLGLTATPERTDQADILALCHHNLVFERNLVHGIDNKVLTPFHYYGIWDDSVNYQEIPWRNGKFDPTELGNRFATELRAKHIFKHWQLHKQSRTLAFCVSKKHADFMADYFNRRFSGQGHQALAVHSSSSVRRNEALSLLDSGQVQVIFSVDLFNEGTDLPSIDTVIMLRPTESNIVFLQQLGRGLRLHPAKTHLVIVDFIGNHNSFFNKQAVLKLSANEFDGNGINKSAPELGAGCYINIDPQTTEFWQRLSKQLRTTAKEDYHNLETYIGHRPTATEYYIANQDDAFKKVLKQHGSWMELVAEMSQDPKLTEVVQTYRDFLFYAVETTSMFKSFKAILLEAFLELDGFRHPPSIETLCQRSKRVLDNYPLIKQVDLIGKDAEKANNPSSWQAYWRKNPIHFSTQADKKTNIVWFTTENDHYQANITIEPHHSVLLTQLVQELVDYRLARYANVKNITASHVAMSVAQQPSNIIDLAAQGNKTRLRYYPNLKIACGHFKTGHHDSSEWMNVDEHNINPERHFLARASGNSMNGGKNPIHDGDLLLLEMLSPSSAGSITGNIMAIEIQDDAGDNQYLLRSINKDAHGQYWLKAHNPDYKIMPANESMKTLARLKKVLTEL